MSLHQKMIVDACFQAFSKQPLDPAQEYVLGSSKISALELLSNTKSCSSKIPGFQDSVYTQKNVSHYLVTIKTLPG